MDDAGVALLGRYLDLLAEANTRMNLTRIVDRASAELAHVGDSLTALEHLPAGAIAVADVGSGGGAPGIPLAIARPEMAVTLIESTKKKAVELRGFVEALGLTNVTVLDQRAEEVAAGRLRESFDVAVARAVGEMVWLAEWCLPLVKRGGKMLAMKGPRVAGELPAALRAIKLLGGGIPEVHPVVLPGTDGHVIVSIKKLGKTDSRYPRPPTSAKGRALGVGMGS